jgi:hypothetical protein
MYLHKETRNAAKRAPGDSVVSGCVSKRLYIMSPTPTPYQLLHLSFLGVEVAEFRRNRWIYAEKSKPFNRTNRRAMWTILAKASGL